MVACTICTFCMHIARSLETMQSHTKKAVPTNNNLQYKRPTRAGVQEKICGALSNKAVGLVNHLLSGVCNLTIFLYCNYKVLLYMRSCGLQQL